MYNNENNKFSQTNIVSYIMLVLFVVVEILSLFAIPAVWFVYGLGMDDSLLAYETSYGFKIFISVIYIIAILLIHGIPIVSTIIQFFCNKRFFKVQLVILYFTIIISSLPFTIFIIATIKNLIYSIYLTVW